MQTKTCTKCGEEKALTEFYKYKRGKYGVTSRCKVCIYAYLQEYERRPEVRERKLEYQRRPEVRERNREYQREYRRRPEVRERQREYRRRPEVRAKKHEYRNRPEQREYELKLKKERYAMGLDSRKHIEVPNKQATRSGKWSDAEMKFLMSSDLPLTDIALELGRTYHSVKRKRQLLRKLQDSQ